MKKVITYGTFDLLHMGHIRLLERAKQLGDYLIVGVTSDDYDKVRGKINVKQSTIERIEGVRATGIADEIIVEEYEGQKIDDIKRYDVDIFTVGSDWVGKFDYLSKYCEVKYLERTQGISSSDIRSSERKVRLGLIGENNVVNKFYNETKYVNGLEAAAVCSGNENVIAECCKEGVELVDNYEKMWDLVDAVYIVAMPGRHYEIIKAALLAGKHVLCEAPLVINGEQSKELFELAKARKLILMDSNKTAYATAFNRLMLLVKSGAIGDVVSVDSTCTSLSDMLDGNDIANTWNSICAWGPTAMLPVFEVLGTDYISKHITSAIIENDSYNGKFDTFTKIDFTYKNAVASIKAGKGVKSEGELIISGTKGYIYVPAPWWKTEYFEVRYEDQSKNKRHFYQLDGEGIRYELVAFTRAIESGRNTSYIDEGITNQICKVIEDFENGIDCHIIG